MTSAAALAALALVCGPALESAGDSSAAQAAAISAPDETPAASAAPAPEPTTWSGLLQIRPSKIAKVAPGSVADAAVIEAAVFGPPGASGALGIPLMVLRAYHQAADRLAVEQPSCKLPWWLLAGIGHTESGHAESGRLTADGTTRGRILGPRLNGGIPGDAIITDTDHGSYDGDKVYDRAVGPMQFIPSTWVRWGVDGNADGKINPSNIFDATLTAGRYLCAGDRNLATAAGLRAAVLSYNHSAPYLATVLAWGAAYRDGASAAPDSPLPVVSDVTKVRPPRSSRPPKPTTNPNKLPRPAGTPTTSSPAGSSSAGASPSASASGSTSASPSETASCPSASPTPTGSESSSSAGAASAATHSLTGSATADGSATTSGSATTDGSATGRAGTASSAGPTGKTSTATSSASSSRSATAQSFTGQSSTAESSTGAAASASTTASSSASSCTP